jgi:hypothetical protein
MVMVMVVFLKKFYIKIIFFLFFKIIFEINYIKTI